MKFVFCSFFYDGVIFRMIISYESEAVNWPNKAISLTLSNKWKYYHSSLHLYNSTSLSKQIYILKHGKKEIRDISCSCVNYRIKMTLLYIILYIFFHLWTKRYFIIFQYSIIIRDNYARTWCVPHLPCLLKI